MAENAALALMKKGKTKEIEFNGGKLELKQLTFNQVNEFQAIASELVDDVESFEKNRKSLATILKFGIVGMEQVTEEDLGEVPLDSLRELSEAVLEFNGLRVADEAKAEGND